MERRLRSSLLSSPEEFLSIATDLTLKSSKPTLKSLIHSLRPSSSSPCSLFTDLPLALHHSISTSIHNLLHPHDPPLESAAAASPSSSPPSKRPRRSARRSNNPNPPNLDTDNQRILNKLHVVAHVAFLCASHPENAFSPADLLPSVQLLHDNLVFLESASSLLSEIANLCEYYWKEGFPGKEMLISQLLPWLLSRSLTLKKKVDVHRVHALREAFCLFDFEDESIEDLKLLLMRCVIAPLYLKTEDGRKFLAFVFGLSLQLMKEGLAMIRSQIAFGRKSILEAYGEVLFRGWRHLEGELKEEFEDGFLQGLIDGAIHASSGAFAASIRRVLGGFVAQRITDGVEKLLFRLAEPLIFRSLQVGNSEVRLNALHLLLDLFPLEDPDATKEVKDTLLDKQFFLLERLLVDDCPDLRVVAVEGCCRVLHLFWEIIPSSTITKTLTKIFDDMSHDIWNEVRLATLNGIIYLIGNPQSHEILKVLLPRFAHLMLDNVLSVRRATVDLLLLIRDIPTFQFNKVVGLDALLSTLANDQPQVAQKITTLLMPSYFPSKVSIEEACRRCVTLIKRSPKAGSRFCEFAVSEGASLKSLMELVRVIISLVVSHDKLVAEQIEGLLEAASCLCNNLVREPCYKTSLKEMFAGGKVKSLLAAASTGGAQSSVLNIFSAVCPDDMTQLAKQCMHIVTNCGQLSEDMDKQAEVRSAHKLLQSCGGFDDMFEALMDILQKAVYRCHIKFGTELPLQRVSPGKRKKCKSSVRSSSKWRHQSGKKALNFKEDYSTAVGIAWQVKDLIASEESWRAILESQTLEFLFHALAVISEVSIVHCVTCEYMEAYPVLAYTALAFRMTLQNISTGCASNSGTKQDSGPDSSTPISELMDSDYLFFGFPLQQIPLVQATDHLLNCVDKLLNADNSEVPGNLPSDAMQDNKRAPGENDVRSQSKVSTSSGNGLYAHGNGMSNKVRMFTAVLKFIVDSVTMGFLSNIHTRCLNFTSAYVKHVILALGQQLHEKVKFRENKLQEIVPYLKSSFSYAAKLLNLILRNATESSSPRLEAFDLVNNMLDLIILIELNLGSSCAAQLFSAAKSWLPDLVLALGFGCLFNQSQAEETYLTALNHIKHHLPSWPLILAKSELYEAKEVGPEEDGGAPEPGEFPVFKKSMDMMISLLKGNPNIKDAVGVVLLAGSVVGLERKDFGLVFGLLHFVCVKLVGEDREWNKLEMMLCSLPDIYPQLEREMDEESDEDARQKLNSARSLLEPVWLFHVYETGRFTVSEE
ncbi:hypothetical protein Tsubulata_001514 [Turnera subulata]|uniref:Uncharacterized protein n=1 Tax=Turnera subulata TaxID=218843 RepID=A0A9Q0F1U4_9ROSI|nr:hypothetical protein Tsubulata_001514 [Turnera subulata]